MNNYLTLANFQSNLNQSPSALRAAGVKIRPFGDMQREIFIMYGIIYKVTGPTGRVYVGQTTRTLARRKGNHKCRALKQDRRYIFGIALLDEGFDNFTWEQIDGAETKEELDRKEKYWINFYDSRNPEKGYNTLEGGTHAKPWIAGKHHTPEACEKMRGRDPWNKGRNLPERYGEKISAGKMGKTIEKTRGENGYQTTITEQTARNIKVDCVAGLMPSEIAKKYNVKRYIVENIKYGKSWKWLNVEATA
ncbi:hypothetical protein FACS1894110_18500 [Spirochaetia bacterium]|nr:hypothetical protein FACS1894110_18500 [Spirochaetia bacterium]